MSRFLQALHSGRVLLMDGAMVPRCCARDSPRKRTPPPGTSFTPASERGSQAYRQAGARVLVTNTFMGHADSLRTTLSAGGHSGGYAEVWGSACSLIRPANAPVFRLMSLGPIAGPADHDYADPYHYKHAHLWTDADAVLLETCSSPRVGYALRHIHRYWKGPVLLSLAFERDATGKVVTHSASA